MDLDKVCESKVDVRIVVSGPDIAQMVSKAINNIPFEKDYNILVSSIIPTMDFDIVKKVAEGADIILIGGYGCDENYNLLFNELKTDFNHIGLFDYNKLIDDDENIDDELAQNEILNSIIKSGLAYSLNIINIHTLENNLSELKEEYNALIDDYNKLVEENKLVSTDNLNLQNKVESLNSEIENIKSNFSDFKLRYEDIYSKDILETFDINKLWRSLFSEDAPDQGKIILATNEFRPKDIVVGQGQICARDKQTAIDWLKIIKTTLIFLNNDNNDLKEEFKQYSKEAISDIDNTSEYDISEDIGNFFN